MSADKNIILHVSTEAGTDVRDVVLTWGRTYLVGRQQGCEIVLASTEVSRRHACVRLDEVGQCFVSDVGSKGGTWLGQQLLQGQVEFPFPAGGVVRVGNYRLSLARPGQGGRKTDANPLSAMPPSLIAVLEKIRPFYQERHKALIHQMHDEVLKEMNVDVAGNQLLEASDPDQLAKLEKVLDSVLYRNQHLFYQDDSSVFRQGLKDEVIGFGPISPLLRESSVTEIMVNGPETVFVECKGKLYEVGLRFFDRDHLFNIIQRIVEPLGRHVDFNSPIVDARLPDGSRVNAVIEPLALQGPTVTIRKFAEKKLGIEDLVQCGSMTGEMGDFLRLAVRARKNVIVSGGTGSGKTTLLNVLSMFIPENERVITIEDSAELKLQHENLVSLEARPPNIHGEGRVTIRDLVVNTLRMRPDRIIVGECRGAEALDMLQAMNTGHDGSLTTCHANSPRDALIRLENMVLMAGYKLPLEAIRAQIASAVDLIIQTSRIRDGSRKVTCITQVTGFDQGSNCIQTMDIFSFQETGVKRDSASRVVKVEGLHNPTGDVPDFIHELYENGEIDERFISIFNPKQNRGAF